MKVNWPAIENEILEKLDLQFEAEQLGVRFSSSTPSSSGWLSCYAVGREDRSPSAGLCVAGENGSLGRYRDHGDASDESSLNFWGLAAKMGPYSDWRSARDHFAKVTNVPLPNRQKPSSELLEVVGPSLAAMSIWASTQDGISLDAVRKMGATLARWPRGLAAKRQQFLLAFPARNEPGGGDPNTFVCVNVNGHPIRRFQGKKKPPELLPKMTLRTGGGLFGICDAERVAAAEVIWKCEGLSDTLALRSVLPRDATDLVTSGAGGASEHVKPAWLTIFAGKIVHIVPDADEAGMFGARRWAAALVPVAKSVRVLRLPFPIQKKHGKDLRDYFADGHSFGDLLTLAEQAPSIDPDTITTEGEPISNAKVIAPDEGSEMKDPIPMARIVEQIREATDGWPRRVGSGLFVHEHESQIDWLQTAAAFTGWLGTKTGRPARFYKAVGCHTPAEVYAEMRRVAQSYSHVEEFPHEPRIPDYYYACEFPEEVGDGSALNGLLDQFSPATDIDRDLIMAMIVTLFLGGAGGTRPAFLLTADQGRGSGKSALASLVAYLVGGAVDLSANEDIGSIKARLLSPDGLARRVALLDNVKSHRFSWSELESLITSPTISGRRMYVGEAARPNNVIWLITLNGASLATDLAQRCVIIKLQKPKFSGTWLERMRRYIDDSRPAIIADCIGFLRSERYELPSYSRWGAWEEDVLSRMPDPTGAQKVILERQGEADTETEEADVIEALFESKLVELAYAVDTQRIHIPSKIAASWLNEATNERATVIAASRRLKQKVNEGTLRRLQVNASRSYGRGFIWVGERNDPEIETDTDIETRITKFEKRTF